MNKIFLHGFMSEKYGHEHSLAVESPAEAVRALSCIHRGFRRDIESGNWMIVRGTGESLGEEHLQFRLGSQSLHIVPVVEGAGDQGAAVGKIVGGLAIAAAAFFFAPAIPLVGAIVANAGIGIGLSLAAGGASSLLSAKPIAANGRDGVEERTSLIFQGVENVSSQGGAVPLVFGRMLVGSVVLSSGLTAEQV